VVICGQQEGCDDIPLGGVVAESRHYPYGVERWSSGTFPTDYRFTGQRFDSYTQLTIMGSRWYDGQIGRWISPDTIIPDPANPQSLNRYAYARNNPLKYRDPTGHWEEEWEKQFEKEHGRPPTEQDWWDYQFSLQISDWSAGAWATTYALRQLLFAAGVTIQAGFDDIAVWHGAFCPGVNVDPVIKWTLSEVAVIGQVISNIAQVFGNNARHIVGGVNFVRLHNARWPLIYAGQKARAFEEFLTVYVNDSAFSQPGAGEHVLTHELGHYLQDSHFGLLSQFRRARSSQFPNRYARDNGLAEDFAASFEIFVFGSIGRPCIENGEALTVDQSRRDFFLQFVRW
jgi:RHS repeat-associated protein